LVKKQGWLVGWLVGVLVGWLVGWLVSKSFELRGQKQPTDVANLWKLITL